MLGIAVGLRVAHGSACDEVATPWPLGAFLNNPMLGREKSGAV